MSFFFFFRSLVNTGKTHVYVVDLLTDIFNLVLRLYNNIMIPVAS